MSKFLVITFAPLLVGLVALKVYRYRHPVVQDAAEESNQEQLEETNEE
jgi:hypothetical protein